MAHPRENWPTMKRSSRPRSDLDNHLEYLIQTRENVQQAVLSLHTQGIYPSLHKVQSCLRSRSMQLREAREAWHAALRELGFES